MRDLRTRRRTPTGALARARRKHGGGAGVPAAPGETGVTGTGRVPWQLASYSRAPPRPRSRAAQPTNGTRSARVRGLRTRRCTSTGALARARRKHGGAGAARGGAGCTTGTCRVPWRLASRVRLSAVHRAHAAGRHSRRTAAPPACAASGRDATLPPAPSHERGGSTAERARRAGVPAAPPALAVCRGGWRHASGCRPSTAPTQPGGTADGRQLRLRARPPDATPHSHRRPRTSAEEARRRRDARGCRLHH